jgi:hypothetical protein
MQPDSVCDKQRTAQDEVRVLNPAEWPRSQSTDRHRYEAVVRPEQALDESGRREDERGRNARGGQRGDHRATFFQAGFDSA